MKDVFILTGISPEPAQLSRRAAAHTFKIKHTFVDSICTSSPFYHLLMFSEAFSLFAVHILRGFFLLFDSLGLFFFAP